MEQPKLFSMDFFPYSVLVTIGSILMFIGLPFYTVSLSRAYRAFDSGVLMTNGVYAVCRHPVYASWIVFLVPGMALLSNYWIGLTAPVFMYIVARVLVKKEESYLEERFGDKYIRYKNKVPAFIPRPWRIFTS